MSTITPGATINGWQVLNLDNRRVSWSAPRAVRYAFSPPPRWSTAPPRRATANHSHLKRPPFGEGRLSSRSGGGTWGVGGREREHHTAIAA